MRRNAQADRGNQVAGVRRNAQADRGNQVAGVRRKELIKRLHTYTETKHHTRANKLQHQPVVLKKTLVKEPFRKMRAMRESEIP